MKDITRSNSDGVLRDVDATGIPDKSGVAVSGPADAARSGIAGFWQKVRRAPFHFAPIGAPGIVALFIIFGGGFGFSRAILPSLTTGEPMGIILAVSTLSFGLLATTAWSMLAWQSAAQTRFEAFARAQEENKSRDDHHDGTVNILVEELHRLRDEIGEAKQFILTQSLKQGPRTDTRKNTVDAWRISSGSDYIAVFGQLRLDVTTQIGPNGRYLTFDAARLRANHVSRFKRDDGTRSITYVLPSKDGTELSESVIYHVVLCRQIAEIAKQDGVEIDLGKAQFALSSGLGGQSSFFVGRRQIGGHSVDFVNTYTDHAQSFGVPRSLIDDLVQVSLDPRVVEAYRNTALSMVERSPVYSYQELEDRFGTAIDAVIADRVRLAGVAEQRAKQRPEPVINGDHFII